MALNFLSALCQHLTWMARKSSSYTLVLLSSMPKCNMSARFGLRSLPADCHGYLGFSDGDGCMCPSLQARCLW